MNVVYQLVNVCMSHSVTTLLKVKGGFTCIRCLHMSLSVLVSHSKKSFCKSVSSILIRIVSIVEVECVELWKFTSECLISC